ncbi:hypothetical protein ACIQCG_41250 [Streptomyces noursei]|uniref:terpene synthase family protein n=1 Tax=Streptomyces noursei TaxID=1971 RepID=UPI0035D62F2B
MPPVAGLVGQAQDVLATSHLSRHPSLWESSTAERPRVQGGDRCTAGVQVLPLRKAPRGDRPSGTSGDNVDTISTPDLQCPFPFTPPDPGHLDFTRTELTQWLDRFPLGDRYLRAGGVELAAYTTPGPSDISLLALTAQFHTWLFATDDTYCDEAHHKTPRAYLKLLPQLLEVLTPPFAPATCDHPFVAALTDLRDRLVLSVAPDRARRFASLLREALLSLTWELPIRAGIVPLDTAGYRSLRRLNGAVGPCLELSGLISGVSPRADELALPAVERLTTLAIDHIGIANDLWSYTKETQVSGQVPTLLPHVLMNEHGIDLEAAVTATAQLCNELIAEFEAGCHRVRPSASPQVLRYLDVLRAWIRGNLQWSATCRRYDAVGAGSRIRLTVRSGRPPAEHAG